MFTLFLPDARGLDMPVRSLTSEARGFHVTEQDSRGRSDTVFVAFLS